MDRHISPWKKLPRYYPHSTLSHRISCEHEFKSGCAGQQLVHIMPLFKLQTVPPLERQITEKHPSSWLVWTSASPLPLGLCLLQCTDYTAIPSCPNPRNNSHLAFFTTSQHSWGPIVNNYLGKMKVKWLLKFTFKTPIQQKPLGDERATWGLKT